MFKKQKAKNRNRCKNWKYWTFWVQKPKNPSQKWLKPKTLMPPPLEVPNPMALPPLVVPNHEF